MLDGSIRNDVLWRKQFHGRKIGWPSELLQKVGEVEGTLWHVWAELIGWNERLESSLKKVDEGLGVFMGLGLSVVDKVEGKRMVELRGGPKFLKNNKFDGMKRGRPSNQAWAMEG